MKTLQKLRRYYTPVLITLVLVTVVSAVTRVALAVKSSAGIDWSFTNIAGMFLVGLFYDIVVAGFFCLPLVLHLWFLNERSYEGKWKWLTPVTYLVALLVLLFTELVPKDFNKDLRLAIIWYFAARMIIYLGLSISGEKFRQTWRKYVLLVDLYIILFVLIFNALAEWFFWDEFSTRFNFIAVDYLVYTNEVIGNIRESYPMGWLLSGIAAVCLLTVFLIRKPVLSSVAKRPAFKHRSIAAVIFIALAASGYLVAKHPWRKFSQNEYVNELAGNGMYEFGNAFWNNELDYFKFYQTIPDKEAFDLMRSELSGPGVRFTSNDPFNLEREISYSEPEKKMNVVLISIESLSADFMKAFGNTADITPHLDSLAHHGMFFTSLYASGTRTVRGLEALSLSIPPTPGQSIVKRPGNENLFSLGSVFQTKGYNSQYIYGGYSYFDNMEHFFSNNGYKVVDRDAIPEENVHYANVWGVADEDLFSLAINEMDSNYHAGKPFFSHVMTVSNHRPFTYPSGRINIPPSKQTREGGVKYTDYCIGKFFAEAKNKPWFNNTIFVIVADHCAGSAGSVQLPVTGYHIPLIIYSPGNIQPQEIKTLCAQIDIAPTILGLLHFNYNSKFFGRDIFTVKPGMERAFISTYQGLGFLRNNKLIIQSPVKKIQAFAPNFTTGAALPTMASDSLVKSAIAWYQCASWIVKNKKYSK